MIKKLLLMMNIGETVIQPDFSGTYKYLINKNYRG